MTPAPKNRAERRVAMRKRATRAAGAALTASGAVTGALSVASEAPAGAVPTTYTVSNLADGGNGSLRKAILDANGNAGADTIVFQAGLSGTITLTTGQLEVEDDVTIQGPGADVISVSGNNASRVFYIFDGNALLEVTISGLTITGGNDASTFNTGGGIQDWGENLHLIDSVVTGNSAQTGAGLGFYNPSGQSEIINSTVADNDADSAGGGVFLYTGDGNTDEGNLTIRNSTISANTANLYGGGLWFYTPLTTVDIYNSTISGNEASQGGGIFFFTQLNAGIDIVQTTITDNHDVGIEGFTEIVPNANELRSEGTPPGRDEGVAPNVRVAAEGETTLVGTIVAGNTGDADILNAGSVISDHSLIGTVGPVTLFTDNGGTLQGVDPLLGPLADNGGPTQTHALLAGSPALDVGPDPVPTFPGNEFDQRGTGFARVANGRVDIGAYELQLVVLFTG